MSEKERYSLRRPGGDRRACVLARGAAATLVLASLGSVHSAEAATIAPPMLDVASLCGASHGHNVNAMSECIVAESEARSEVLRQWATVPEATAQKCKKLSGKAKRQYTALANCLDAAKK